MSDKSDNNFNEKKKQVIEPKEWISQLNKINVSKFDLNKIVMNFFLVEGYKEAAESFAQESGTELSSFDIEFMNKRMEIKQLIHQGTIDQAIDKINQLNPDILINNQELLLHLRLQKLIEVIKQQQVQQAIDYASTSILPLIKDNMMEQLEKVMCLLAFDQPQKSPLNNLVEQSQRIKLSSQVNTQLLKKSNNIEKENKLPILLKLMFWQQNKLSHFYHFPQIIDVQTAHFQFTQQ